MFSPPALGPNSSSVWCLDPSGLGALDSGMGTTGALVLASTYRPYSETPGDNIPVELLLLSISLLIVFSAAPTVVQTGFRQLSRLEIQTRP